MEANMDKAKIIENNIIDLKIGLELAEIAENDFLKNYTLLFQHIHIL
jgi:hypothetical protein